MFGFFTVIPPSGYSWTLTFEPEPVDTFGAWAMTDDPETGYDPPDDEEVEEAGKKVKPVLEAPDDTPPVVSDVIDDTDTED
jgi:hypothetical protein